MAFGRCPALGLFAVYSLVSAHTIEDIKNQRKEQERLVREAPVLLQYVCVPAMFILVLSVDGLDAYVDSTQFVRACARVTLSWCSTCAAEPGNLLSLSQSFLAVIHWELSMAAISPTWPISAPSLSSFPSAGASPSPPSRPTLMLCPPSRAPMTASTTASSRRERAASPPASSDKELEPGAASERARSSASSPASTVYKGRLWIA